MLQFPAFHEQNYTDHQANVNNRVITINIATPEQFADYCVSFPFFHLFFSIFQVDFTLL